MNRSSFMESCEHDQNRSYEPKRERKIPKKHMANYVTTREIHPYTTSIKKKEMNSTEMSIEYGEVNTTKEECNEIEQSAEVIVESILHNNSADSLSLTLITTAIQIMRLPTLHSTRESS